MTAERSDKKAPLSPPEGGKQPTLRSVQIRKTFKPSLFSPFGGVRGGLMAYSKQKKFNWKILCIFAGL